MEGPARNKSICIFESIGGSDKGPDGHRKDTIPILECIKAKGWTCDVVNFENEKADEIYHNVVNKYCGYIGRVNPGSLPDNEAKLFEIMRKLSANGLTGMTHPDSMINFGAKSALVTLNKTGLVPEDTYAYYDIQSFKDAFPKTLSYSERVLKQNRGSTG